ncbi:MAG: sigma-54-dependent transcriptional regulator [Nitrospirota bacterium]
MDNPLILIIDDDDNILLTLTLRLESYGYDVVTSNTGVSGIELCKERHPDMVLLDLKMPDINGLEVLKEIKQISYNIEVIILTAQATIESAVIAIKEGAYDYLTKPIESHKLKVLIERALEKGDISREVKYLRRQLIKFGRFGKMLGNSSSMQKVYHLIEKVADTTATVLITGESGTGKELVAKTIHEVSHRKRNPFIAVNCSTIPINLWESEMFGYEKGAFTGATNSKKGIFELANDGTLFLDEVSEMSLETQSKFLRILEEKKFRKVGGSKEVHVDIRLIGATNKNLVEAVKDGLFRRDLYYRLNVFNISLPPLSERKDDIPILVQGFLEEFRQKHEKSIRYVTRDSMDIFYKYSWPGNVRELRNCIERAVILCNEDEIDSSFISFSEDLSENSSSFPFHPGLSLAQVEEELICKTLAIYDGNKNKTSEALGISLKTLYNKLNQYKYNETPNRNQESGVRE